jgi:hypothetical protein
MVDIIPRGQSVNSSLHIQTLKTLQKRFWIVRSHKNVAETLRQHDNARTNRNMKTLEAIPELRWSVLPLPQRSLDLAPSHFHLFGDF